MKTVSRVAAALSLLAMAASAAPAAHKVSIRREQFGRIPAGSVVYRYTLTNRNGMEARIMSYGGIVQSLRVPNGRGGLTDVVLGFPTVGGYIKHPGPYFGALIGRYGNRIARGRFRLDGKTYHIPINNPPNSLHGGLVGFDKRIWAVQQTWVQGNPSLVMSYISKDGEEGYPGNLRVKVVYTLTGDNSLRIRYEATTDRDTVLNLTNHSYFNLAGQGNRTILDHVVTIKANYITPVDKTLIPTGKLMPVAGTPFDFRHPTPIGARINSKNQQIQYGPGYDHNFVLSHAPGQLGLAARVWTPRSRIVMDVYTTQPGMQFYSGNFLDGTFAGKGGKVYYRRDGFAMETQHYPDSPNHRHFPTTELKPGQVYHQLTIYHFGVR